MLSSPCMSTSSSIYFITHYTAIGIYFQNLCIMDDVALNIVVLTVHMEIFLLSKDLGEQGHKVDNDK